MKRIENYKTDLKINRVQKLLFFKTQRGGTAAKPYEG